MKDVRFIWGLPQEDSFMKLKELITSAPVLVLPNNDLLFRLEADGSGIATGAVLSQQNVNNNAWHIFILQYEYPMRPFSLCTYKGNERMGI
jgi:hypothetical protein